MYIKINKWVCVGLWGVMALVPITSWAIPRSATQARTIAQEFMKQNSTFAKCTGVNLNLIAYDKIAAVTRGAENENPAYYIFNLENNEGYIIVSGDDQAKEVLGYSDKGTIDVNNMAPNLKYWLGFYEKQIKYVMNNPATEVARTNVVEAAANKEYAPSVSPLLGEISYDQGAPYNALCPEDKTTGKQCVTGCVATAMSSVMRYYKYPEKGTGSHSYTSEKGGKLSANFGNTKYDWDNILPSYKGSETDEQIEAIATLMLHCGIALEMKYSSDASGTSQNYIMDALTTYFGYNPYMVMRTRDQHTYTEWFNMIKEELNNGRPLCYGGQSKGGGHSFILDGYDTAGKVHFDWGWNGYQNGYYELNAINPAGGGTGAGDGAYSGDQTIILRLQPEVLGEKESLFIISENLKANRTSYSRDDKITITCNWIWNYCTGFNGSIGLALYTEDEQFVTILDSPSPVTLWPNGSGYQSKQYSGSVPSTVANGTYRLYVVSKDLNEKGQSKILAPLTTFSYYTTVITDDGITLTAPEAPEADMVLTQIDKVVLNDGYVSQDTPTTFSYKLTNTGLEYFKGLVGVYFRKKGGSTFQRIEGETYTVDYKDVVDVTVTGTFTKSPGTYVLVGCYSEDNGKNWVQFPLDKYGLEVEVYPTGIENAESVEFSVTHEEGNFVVRTSDETSTVEIYTVSGMKVLQQIPNGGNLYFKPDNKGVYIVRQNDKSVKIVY